MDIARFPPEIFPKRAKDFKTDMNGQRKLTTSRIGKPEKAILDRTRICFRTHSNPLQPYD
jgi:hypothetical protein